MLMLLLDTHLHIKQVVMPCYRGCTSWLLSSHPFLGEELKFLLCAAGPANLSKAEQSVEQKAGAACCD